MQPSLPMQLPVSSPPGTFPVGARVGAGRVPNQHAHPSCWGQPWTGVVLPLDAPEAWAGSVAFPEAKPAPLSVSEHVARCLRAGLLRDKVPVRWDFGKVLWENPGALRTPEADRAAWTVKRAAALALGSL